MDVNLFLSILITAGPYIAVTAGLTLCLFLHTAPKRDCRRRIPGVTSRIEAAEQRLQLAESALAEMRLQSADLEEQVRLSSGAPAKSWTNINRRAQAVRMLRSGDSAARIATELSMTRGEVELIRKVHSLTNNAYENSSFSFGD